MAMGSGVKRCVEAGGCDAVGEACTGPAQCCSNACANDGSGFLTCQFLGGCRPDKERCDKDGDCCTGRCVTQPTGGIKRCERPGGCAGVGEICDGSFHLCCPDGDEGKKRCRVTVAGVKRCFGSSDPTACIPDAMPCVFSDECCGKRCLPQPDGTRRCSAAGAPNGGGCTAHSDCQSGNCDALAKTCKPPVVACVPLGGACTTAADCCSGVCNTMTKTCTIYIP
jgi:hypothetical protein